MASNRTFHEPKSAEEESEILENAVKKLTACEEESGSAVETSQIQDLEMNICNMTAKSLNFWLTKFIMEVCKDTGETYLPRTLYRTCIFCLRCFVCNSCLFSWPLHYNVFHSFIAFL